MLVQLALMAEGHDGGGELVGRVGCGRRCECIGSLLGGMGRVRGTLLYLKQKADSSRRR